MKLIGKGGVSHVVGGLLIALMCVVPALMVSLPWSIPWITDKYPGDPLHLYEKYLVILIASGLLAEVVLWQAHGIMRNVNRGHAFCTDTARRLRVMGWECLTLGAAYGALTFLVTKIFMAVVMVTFVTVGMVLLVFAELFRQAVVYKEENDMTI